MRLEVSDLACERGGHRVFEGVSFHLDAGGMMMLTGPNGAGKSSLLRLLAGLGAPVSGTVHLDDLNIAEDPETAASRRVYVGHADALKPVLTVTENLAFWTRLQRGRENVGDTVAQALDTLGLATLAGTPARYLSAGQRRRATLARALASGAKLWLLDEPATALDAASLKAFEAALAGHLAEGGIAVVSSHVPVAGATDTLQLGGSGGAA